jgi:hypothetical protein
VEEPTIISAESIPAAHLAQGLIGCLLVELEMGNGRRRSRIVELPDSGLPRAALDDDDGT